MVLVLLEADLVLSCLAVHRIVKVQRAGRLAYETSQKHDTDLLVVHMKTLHDHFAAFLFQNSSDKIEPATNSNSQYTGCGKKVPPEIFAVC